MGKRCSHFPYWQRWTRQPVIPWQVTAFLQTAKEISCGNLLYKQQTEQLTEFGPLILFLRATRSISQVFPTCYMKQYIMSLFKQFEFSFTHSQRHPNEKISLVHFWHHILWLFFIPLKYCIMTTITHQNNWQRNSSNLWKF